MAKTYSAKQVASRIGTDAKTLRKFFRDPKSGFDAVGQGGRYDFTEDSIPVIKKAFDEWSATKTKRTRTPRSAEGKLADRAGVTPRKRAAKPEDDAPAPRKHDPKNGLHGNALDDDTLETRLKLSIAERAARHDLITNQQGRFVNNPYPRIAKMRPAEGHEPKHIPGLGTLYFPIADSDGVEREEFNDADIPGTGDEDEALFWAEDGGIPANPEDYDKVMALLGEIEEEEE